MKKQQARTSGGDGLIYAGKHTASASPLKVWVSSKLRRVKLSNSKNSPTAIDGDVQSGESVAFASGRYNP